jgi:hypothetical protein
LTQAFDVIGRWIFGSAKQSEIEKVSSNIQKALEFRYDKAFEIAILEVEKSYSNLTKSI